MLKSYLPNVFGLTLIQGLNLVVPVLFIPIIVDTQGIDAYGEYATVIAYFFFGSLICDYGFDYSAARELKRQHGSPQDRERIVCETLSAKWLLFVFAGPASAVAIALFGGIKDLYLILVGVLLPLTSVFSVNWLYLAEGKLARVVVPIGVARLASLVAVLGIYPRWPSIALVTLFTFAPVVIVQATFWLREVAALKKRDWFSVDAGLRAIRSGRSAFYITFITSYMAMSSVLAMSMFSAARDLAVFAAVDRIARAAFGVAKPFLVALYPEMTALFFEARAQWRSIVMRIVAIACAVGGVSFLLIALWWTELSQLIFGQPIPESKWIAYGFAMWLTIGLVNNALGIQGLIASGSEAVYAKGATIAAFVLTAGYLAVGAKYGALGVIYSMVASEGTFLALNARAFRMVSNSDAK